MAVIHTVAFMDVLKTTKLKYTSYYLTVDINKCEQRRGKSEEEKALSLDL